MNTLCNTSMLNEINAGKFRFSIAPEGTGTFFNEVYMNSSMDQIFYSLNSRTWLSKLFSVKYFLAKEGIVPYGVVKKVRKQDKRIAFFTRIRIRCLLLIRMTVIFRYLHT